MDELDAAVAVVTGGGNGIGAGIAAVLGREGATVVVTDLDEARAHASAGRIAEAGGQSHAVHHDVTSAASCAEVVAGVIDRFGRLDVLVNNAGISSRSAFRDLDEAEWDRMMNVNLKSLFLMTKAAVEPMIEQSGGAIINTASIAGKEAFPNFSHYSVTKFGVIALTQALAKEFAPFGIRVNAVCPGVVRTTLWEPLLDEAADHHRVADAAANRQVDALDRCHAAEALGASCGPTTVGCSSAGGRSGRALMRRAPVASRWYIRS